MAERLEGIELPVDALIQIGVDPASVAAVRRDSERLGKAVSDNLSKGLTGSGDPFKDLERALAGASSRAARDKAFQNYLQSVIKLAREAAAAVAAVNSGTGPNAATTATREATEATARWVTQINGVAGAQRAAATASAGASDKALAGTEEIIGSLRRVFRETKGNEQAFESLANVITASINKAAREISKDIVGEQTAQQLRGIQKAAQQQAFQAQKDAARQALQVQKATDRELEQERGASYRRQLAEQRSALAQGNSILNASLQEGLIEERGAQQRRTALVRASLDTIRSAYKATGSGISSVVSAMYSRITADTAQGEDRVTAANRQGLLRRKQQTEAIMGQTTAEVRKQLGTYQAAQTQLDRGVLGAAAGTSAFGASLRGIAIGGAGAFGLGALINEASGFEANLRVFAALNQEVAKSPELFAALREQAIGLGNDIALPGVSAADAADALTALAKTGLSVEDSIASARSTLLLARVAGVDFAEAARTVGSTLNAMGLEGKDATAAVDQLSKALSLSGGATFDELRQGQSQVLAPFFNAFQFAQEPIDSLASLNAGLALLSKNALRGSDAGTSLKQFINALTPNSGEAADMVGKLLSDIGEGGNFLFDAAGNARTFTESINTVREAFLNLAPAQRADQMEQIFGSDAVRAAAIFVNSTEGELEGLIDQVLNKSKDLTLEIAKAQNQGLKAGVDAFVSTIETIFIRVFAVVDKPLGNFVVFVADAVGKLASDPAFEIVRQALLGIAAGLAAIGLAKAALETFRLLGLLLGSLTSPLGLLTVGFAALGGIFVVLYKQSEPFRDVIDGIIDRVGDFARSVLDGVIPALSAFGDFVSDTFGRALEAVSAFFSLILSGNISEALTGIVPTGFLADFVDFVLRAREAVIDAFAVLSEAAKIAFGQVTEALGDFRQALAGEQISGPLGAIAATVRVAFQGVVDVLTFITDFVLAVGRTIEQVGIFEGLRLAAEFSLRTLLSVVGEIFGAIGGLIADAFGLIDWETVAGVVLLGLFSVFYKIGDAVGTFIGSEEFLRTVGIALGAIAALLGSAAGGLIAGFVEGFRTSDAGKAIGQALLDAVTEGFEFLLASFVPPVFLYKLFTDPFGSALGAAVLVVEAILIGKIVRLFYKGFALIADAVAGFRLVPQVLSQGLSSIEGDLNAANKTLVNHDRTIRQVNERYGPFAGAAVRAGAAINRFGEFIGVVQPQVETTQRTVEGLTDSLGRPLTAAVSTAQTQTSRLADGFTTLRTSVFNATNLIGGLSGGLGFGFAITADDPITKLTSVAAGVTSLVFVVQEAAALIRTAGLTAGLLSGGVGIALTAIATAVTFFISRGSEAKAAADAVGKASDSYVKSFRRILDITGGSRAQTSLEFYKTLIDQSDDLSKEFGGALDEVNRDLRSSSEALVGSEGDFKRWRKGITDELGVINFQIDSLRNNPITIREDETAEQAATRVGSRIAALEEERKKREEALVVIDDTRASYEEALETNDRMLVIERNLKEVEDERKAIAEKVLDQRRGERDMLDSIATKIRDLINLDEERRRRDTERAERGAVRDFLETVVPTTNEDGTTTPSQGNLTELFADQQTEAADAAEEALLRLRDQFSETAAQATRDGETYAGYIAALSTEQAALVEELTNAGLSRQEAETVAEFTIGPLRDKLVFTTGVVEQLGTDLNTLGVRIGQDFDFKPITAEINDKPARDALEKFVKEPEAKNIQGLLDLGLPVSVLEEFVRNPTELTLEAIVDTQNAIDTIEGFLADGQLTQVEIDALINTGVAEETLGLLLADGNLDQKDIDAIITEASRVIAERELGKLTETEAKRILVELDIPEATASFLGQFPAFGGFPGGVIPAPEVPELPDVPVGLDLESVQKALEDFRSGVDTESIFDFGVPTALLDTLINAPDEKTVQLIVDATNATAAVEEFLADGYLDEKEIRALANMGIAEATVQGFLADGVLDQKDIDAIVTAASVAAARGLFFDLTRPERKQILVDIGLNPNTAGFLSQFPVFTPGRGLGLPQSKYGRIVTEPMISWLGEEGRKEVVIPLTMPNRAAQLYEQSGLANVLAKAGVMAPGSAPNVQRVVATTGGSGPSRSEFAEVVGELRSLRSDLREDMDTRRDNVFLMEGVEKPYPTARQTASKLRRKRRRR